MWRTLSINKHWIFIMKNSVCAFMLPCDRLKSHSGGVTCFPFISMLLKPIFLLLKKNNITYALGFKCIHENEDGICRWNERQWDDDYHSVCFETGSENCFYCSTHHLFHPVCYREATICWRKNILFLRVWFRFSILDLLTAGKVGFWFLCTTARLCWI